MCTNCSTELIDQFNENNFFSSSNSLANDHLTFVEQYSDQIVKSEEINCPKGLEYDEELNEIISVELGLNDPQISRKNAWGNLSYAELITKAILNSDQQRLTLSQIYSWIILYVPHFRDKSAKKNCQGWKNSIRHNLSLHNRFVRIPNEIPGKSSWWTIDFNAKLNRGRKKDLTNKTPKSSFTSVRDFNQAFYSNFQSQNATILHDMLKSSSSPSSSHTSNEDIDWESDNHLKLKSEDRSNPPFRRMCTKLTRIEMNQTNQRNPILSTPPPDSIQFNQQHFDQDIQTILHFEQTTFGDEIFDMHDLPNL